MHERKLIKKEKNFKLQLGLPLHIGFRIRGQINEIRGSLIKYKSGRACQGTVCLIADKIFAPRLLVKRFVCVASPSQPQSLDVHVLMRHVLSPPPPSSSPPTTIPPLPVAGTQTRPQIATSHLIPQAFADAPPSSQCARLSHLGSYQRSSTTPPRPPPHPPAFNKTKENYGKQKVPEGRCV